MRLGRFLIGTAATVIAIRWISAQIKRYEKKAELSDNLNRWEGEGGNVPSVESSPQSTTLQRASRYRPTDSLQ